MNPKGENTGKTEKFFEEQQAAAVLKHSILQPWLHVFASKTGSRAPGNRVVYLDGYAGPGTYDDGAPGSPALAAETAENLARNRNLEGHYVEVHRKLCQDLRDMLKGTDHTHHVYQGRIEKHLPTIIESAGDAPMFAFFDPFGLGIPLDMLTDQVLNRKTGTLLGGPTEVLLNFSLPGLRRNAGKKTQPKVLARLDGMLGGPWWREIWEANGEDRETEIVRGYAARIVERTPASSGWAWVMVPVSKTWDGNPVYWLIFVTHFPRVVWDFNNVLSRARERFYEFTHRGQLDLDPLPDREARLSAGIKANLEQVVATSADFVMNDKRNEIYGDFFGQAREKHVRAAAKALCNEGKIVTESYDGGRVLRDGKGNVQFMRVLRREQEPNP